MAKKAKLPKTIAGVKVPKILRQSGSIDALLNSEIGRKVLADAIMAAATAAAAALVQNRPSGAQVVRAGEAVVDAGTEAASTTKDLVQGAVGVVAGAVTEAAQHVLPASLTGAERSEDKSNDKTGDGYAVLANRETEDKRRKARDKAREH